MQIKPIMENYNPQYPNSNEVKDIGKVLNNKKPKRWLKNAAIAGLISGFALTSIAYLKSDDIKKDTSTRIAPIFVHGNGVGSFGCMVVCPPVFITESEVKKIIYNEFNEAGIVLSDKENIADSIVLDFNNYQFEKSFETNKDTIITTIEKRKVKFFAINEALNIGIIYINQANSNFYNAKSSDDYFFEAISSVSSDDYKKCAQSLREKLLSFPFTIKGLIIAVFYEPVSKMSKKEEIQYIEENHKCPDKFNKLSSIDSLKAQVKDFINWYRKG